MSAFNDLAKPAPSVEAAVAERAPISDPIVIERLMPGEDVKVTPAPLVEAATIEPPRQTKDRASEPKAFEISDQSVGRLRAGGGIRFEGKAGVLNGPPQKNILRRLLPILYEERDFVSMGEVARYIIVKDEFCFIYGQESDSSPLYVVPLGILRAIKENPKKPDKNSVTVSPRVNTNEAREKLVTILLRYRDNNKHAYQFTFDTKNDEGVAERFLGIVNDAGEKYATGRVESHAKHGK